MITRHIGTLLALQAIDRLSSFSAAAQELGISQSAVSMKIVRLERELKVRLVERTTRSVILSTEGKVLVEASSQAIADLESALAGIKNRQKVGTLTVEVLSSIATKWLIPRLGKFHEQNPDIRVIVMIQDDQTEPLGADADVAIRIANSSVSGLHSEFLTSESIFPVCAPELERQIADEPIQKVLETIALLDDRMALKDGSACNWTDWIDDLGIQRRASRQPRMVFDRADLMLQAAISGQGIGIGRTFICVDDIASDRLIVPFDHLVRLKWSYYLVSRASVSGWPKVIRFRSWLKQEFDLSQEQAKVLGLWKG